MKNGAKVTRGLRVLRLSVLFLLAGLLTACAGNAVPVAPTPVDVPIKVFFQNDSDGDLCAFKVDPEDPLTFKGKKISWQAVNQNGDTNIRESFDIYFDPIQGSPLTATNGTLSRVIDSDAPNVKYKYTIWDSPQGNDPNVCEPLDPHFRVN